MAQQVLTNLDMNSVSKIVNLPAPTAAGDAANKGYVDGALEGLAWKDNVKCASSSNITVSSPGTTIDGITMATNDRVLLLAQTAQTDNGIYIYNGSATPLTRSYDATQGSDLLNAIVSVDQGTSGGSTFRQTAINITIGTTNIVWGSFGTGAPAATTSVAGVAALATSAEVNAGSVTNKIVTPATLATYTGLLKKYTVLIGDGSSTSYTVTHNLGTQDFETTVYRNSGNYDVVQVEIRNTSTTSATIVFTSAPASNAFKVVVIG